MSFLKGVPRQVKFLFILITFFLISAIALTQIFLFEDVIYTFVEPANPVIVIDAGHGGEDSGAIGANGVYEKDLNLEIAGILGGYFEKAGYFVIQTRTTDALLYTEEENIKGMRKIYDLKNRLKIAESYDDAIFISIHMNSFGEEKYSGLQVYYSKNNEKSKKIADAIHKEVKSGLQSENKRLPKAGENIYIMENSTHPAVLIECGFISNMAECERLCQKEYQKELSFAIFCAIINLKV